MRYAASEKLEIIRLVEQSSLPVRRTLAQIGIPKSTFYAWYDRYAAGGLDALEDHRPQPKRVWNRIPDEVRQKIIELALEESDLSPREIAVTFTDRERSYVSEASVYRLLKAHGLITSPAFIVMKAADEFKDKTTAINQLWQTDFTYLKVNGSCRRRASSTTAGIICRPCWMTSPDTSSRGSSAPPWQLQMSLRLWKWRLRLPGSTRSRCGIGRVCLATTDRPTSPRISLIGSMTTA